MFLDLEVARTIEVVFAVCSEDRARVEATYAPRQDCIESLSIGEFRSGRARNRCRPKATRSRVVNVSEGIEHRGISGDYAEIDSRHHEAHGIRNRLNSLKLPAETEAVISLCPTYGVGEVCCRRRTPAGCVSDRRIRQAGSRKRDGISIHQVKKLRSTNEIKSVGAPEPTRQLRVAELVDHGI